MFGQLTVQILHQYGKYLSFHNAYNNSKEPIHGISQGYNKDETIVRFIPKSGGYQIKHQYGKYLSFHNAYNNSKEPVYGISQGYNEDETIVHFIPKGGGYQIKHQYGKYLSFHNAYAYNNSEEPVYGMKQGYNEDETIVRFIPINYTFSIKIEDYQYDTTRVHDAQLKGKIEQISLISKTFNNKSKSHQKFSISESVTLNTSTTFEHSSTEVRNWLNELSGEVEITTEGKVGLPLAAEGGIQIGTSIGYKYTWSNESTEQFGRSNTESVERTVNVTDEITVGPESKMMYKYIANQLSGIGIPYRAVMKIKCKMGGIYVSDRALEFILNHIGNCPDGSISMKNGHGIYSTKLTGEITPEIVFNFSSHCDELPL